MIPVKEIQPDVFVRLSPGHWVESLDGQFKVSAASACSASWTDEDRAAFGIELVEEQYAQPNFDIVGQRFERVDGAIVHILDVVERAPVVPVTPTVTPLQFMQRFTLEERVAIRQSNDPYIQDFFDLLRASTEVHLDNPLLEQGMDLLVAHTFIDEARKAEILA